MCKLSIHCAISKKRTGEDFKELHQWIDGPYKIKGMNHRSERHFYNKMDEKTIKEFWDKKGKKGDVAVVEWLFHIALDNLNTAFRFDKKMRGTKAKNYFEFGLTEASRYVCFDFDCLSDMELERRFQGFKAKDED
jgi:hypothetical protein